MGETMTEFAQQIQSILFSMVHQQKYIPGTSQFCDTVDSNVCSHFNKTKHSSCDCCQESMELYQSCVVDDYIISVLKTDQLCDTALNCSLDKPLGGNLGSYSGDSSLSTTLSSFFS